jgi:hypothetical protein
VDLKHWGQCPDSTECYEAIVILYDLSSSAQTPQFLARPEENAGISGSTFRSTRSIPSIEGFPSTFSFPSTRRLPFLYKAGRKPFQSSNIPTTNGVSVQTNGVNGHPGSLRCTIDEFTSQACDFVVVGGGTAGLDVATRLTKNPDVKVGVIEAGENLMNDKNVSNRDSISHPHRQKEVRLVHGQYTSAECG